MTVPFERLGPGQVGRLAYQVIGRDGPIFNPNNIRYLDPGTQMEQISSYAEAATALAGLNLVVSSGAVALSAATLREVRKLKKKVDAVLFGIERIESNLEDIGRKVDRIDMRVAENNLREAMKHVLSRAVHPDEIDLKMISELRNDLNNLFEAISSPVYFNIGIRLATDIRDHLSSIYALLVSVRMLVAERHNKAVRGNPEHVVGLNLTVDYLRILGVHEDINSAVAYRDIASCYGGTLDAILESVSARFTFSDKEDLKHFQQLLESKLAYPLEQVFSERFQGGRVLYHVLPEEVFDGSADDIISRLQELAMQWLWTTDSGLLLRAKIEMDALAHGYDKIVWTHLLDQETVVLEELTVMGELPSSA